MDSITSAINKTIYDAISNYTNTLIDNGLLNCSFDTAISHFTITTTLTTTTKKKKSKPDVIKSLPMWTPHHFDSCIALVGDCMAQCSLSKTQGQFCTACAKKCNEDGIPPNGTIFMRTSYQYTAPNGKSPKPFIESTIYKKKIKEGESPAQIRQYYDDLHFDISPLNWGDTFKSSNSAADNSSEDTISTNKLIDEKPTKKSTKATKANKDTDEKDNKVNKATDEKPIKNTKKPTKANKANTDEKKSTTDEKSVVHESSFELTAEQPDQSDHESDHESDEPSKDLIPNSFHWTFKGTEYLAVNLPGGDKNIYDLSSHLHIGIFNARSQRLIQY
jgi:hypothetical protein